MRAPTTSFALALFLGACGTAATDVGEAVAQGGGRAQAPVTGAQPFAAKDFDVTRVAAFDSPWAMTTLPGGALLVSEKAGTMKLVLRDARGTATVILPVGGIPKVDSAGQGGLMDVVFRPGTDMLYFSYAGAGAGGKGVVLARGRFVQDAKGPRLDAVETLFRAPGVDGNGHYSGRIAFAPDGHLFFTVGERQKFDPAQDPKSPLGKILRLTADGKPAPGNPLAAKGFDPAVWSYGHRNLLGIAFDARGTLWEQEMGPKGGDELNVILPGRNYGYPIVSNGDHYDGRAIPDHPTRPDLEAPKASWNPVISPAGLMIYSGTLFPAWTGNAFIGGLSSKALVRVKLDGTDAREAARYDMGARIREVEQGPDGAVYVLEDGPKGRLLRLTPKRG